MNDEVWVLGATGRSGRAIAARLHSAGVPLVLVGRNSERLNQMVADLDRAPRTLAGTLESALAHLADEAPAVVVNTVGPFTETAPAVVAALPRGTGYVDLANDLTAVQQVLDLDRQAVDAGRTLVTGAGFGVLATESVLLRLCQDRPRPAAVRVDAIASVATESGVVGSALATTIIDVLALGGRQVRDGRLVRTRLGADPVRLTTPDGDEIGTGSGPSGELLAAWRASGAASVIAASTAVPTGKIAQHLVSGMSVLLRVPVVGRLAGSAIGKMRTRAKAQPRNSSWAHAHAEWPDGTVRDGWLRAGEGMDFTSGVAAEVIRRLANGHGTPGAHTPGALFGATLAEAAGGQFVRMT